MATGFVLLAAILNLGFTASVAAIDDDEQYCGGTVLPESSSCCGSVSYDPDDYICCEGTVHRNYLSAYACCGSEAYYTGDGICCQGSVQWKPSSAWTCCGNHSYSVEISMCCIDTVQWKPSPSYSCCGREQYNSEVQSCCADGTVQWIGECNESEQVAARRRRGPRRIATL